MNRREFFQFLIGGITGAAVMKAADPKPPIYVITVPDVTDAQLAECRARFKAVIEEFNQHTHCYPVCGPTEIVRLA